MIIPKEHPAHKEVITLIGKCRTLSKEYMSQRYPAFEKAEKMDRAFIDVSETDSKGKKKNPFDRQVYIPISRAIADTVVTYLMTVICGKRPYIKMHGRGGEDQKPAKTMEVIIDYQMERQRALLIVYTFLRDMMKYGFSTIKNVFGREYQNSFANIQRMVPFPFPHTVTERAQRKTMAYEGPQLSNNDIYKTWPDPRVPMAKMNTGQFIGYEYSRSKYHMLKNQNVYFNLEQLPKESAATSTDSNDGEGNRNEIQGISSASVKGVDEKNPMYNIKEFYIEIIPKDYKLETVEGFDGSPSTPEIWVFATVNDELVVRAEKSIYAHGRLPNNSAELDPDGHSLFNQSFYESVEGLQDLLNWLYNSRMANVRAWLNNRAIIDPSVVNMRDILRPNPASLIRLKKELWGKGIPIDQYFHQLEVGDVTQSHVKDADFIADLMQRRHHTSDTMQGVETQIKRTATEIADMKQGGISHKQVQAQVIYAQSMVPMGEMMVQNNQQFLSQERYYRISGEFNQQLIQPNASYPGGNAIMAGPDDIQGFFDFPIDDGTMPSRPHENAEVWREIFNTVVTAPPLQAQIDIMWIFKQLAESLNVKNIDDARIDQGQMNINALPPEVIQAMVAKGDALPIDQLGG